MPCVINFDLPFSAEDYVHRIGRTGRAGASGDALSIYVPSDERLLVDIEKLIKRSVPRSTLEGFDPTGEKARQEETDRRRQRTDVRRARGNGDGESDDRRRRQDHGGGRNAFRPSDDPFFSRPYEPGPNSASAKPAEEMIAAALSRGRQGPKRPVAALLGGAPRKS
jgi:superfamily II DNA/RNA helicase